MIDKVLRRPLWQKILLIFSLIALGWFGYTKIGGTNRSIPQYQTATAEKGTLVVSVTGSGDVSTANSAPVTTKAAGVVMQLYVKDGDTVKTGDKIAEIELDLAGQQTNAQAWSSYQSAQNNLDSAKTTMFTLQSAMFGQWQSHYELATNTKYQNADGTPNKDTRVLTEFNISQDDWLASEAKYKNQQNVVAQAQTALNSAWLSYQQSSPTIYAPISGKITGLSLQVGSVISGSNSSSTSTSASTKIASVQTDAPPTISISLTEIDVPKIKVGNRATITFDSFPDSTYTGKVVSIDTVGSVTSGVTTYPAVIRLDTKSDAILSNMGVTANIISQTKDNVLMVPSSAIQKQSDGTSYVRVLKNGKVNQVIVTTGLTSSTETEIVTGLSEGDVVITNIISQTTGTTGSGVGRSSVFGGGFGGNVRMGR